MWKIVDWVIYTDWRCNALAAPDSADSLWFQGKLVKSPLDPEWRWNTIKGEFHHTDPDGTVMMSVRGCGWRIELGEPHAAYEEVFPGARAKVLEACTPRIPYGTPLAPRREEIRLVNGKFPRRTGGSGLRGGPAYPRRRR